jgi:hypothetical protein
MADPPKKTKVINDWVNRPPQARHDITEQRRKLWEALTAFIYSNGGNVVSPPGGKSLRVEVPSGSSLPARLIEYGYNPRYCGVGTRLSPGNTPEDIFRNVDVIEIALGK